MIFLVTIPYPTTELRLQGDGALQVLAQLRQLYPSLTVVTAEAADLGEESDDDWIDITETEWYRTRTAQITPGRCLRIYRETPEFQARWDFFTEFGAGTFGLADSYNALLPADAIYLQGG